MRRHVRIAGSLEDRTHEVNMDGYYRPGTPASVNGSRDVAARLLSALETLVEQCPARQDGSKVWISAELGTIEAAVAAIRAAREADHGSGTAYSAA